MATDPDVMRQPETVDGADESLELLKANRDESQSDTIDFDDVDTVESYELPGADLSEEELSVRAVPLQNDEFTCMSCFLAQHRSRLASNKDGTAICIDCTG